VISWPPPHTCKTLQAFLGLINWFSEHIPNMATLAAPLNAHRNNKHFHSTDWTPVLQTSFMKLKQALQLALNLSYPDFAAPFFLSTDASKTGIGGILYQLDSQQAPRYISSFPNHSHPQPAITPP
jgi:hypothetical protein